MWVPATEQRRRHEERRRHHAQILAGLEQQTRLNYWDQELRKIDEHLTLVRAQPDATTPGLKPGYYHVVRNNPGAPATIIPVQGPNGEFREPDSGMLEELKFADMWRDKDRLLRLQEAKDRERDREAARAAEEARGELTERLRAYGRESVLFSPDSGFRMKNKRLAA